MSRDANGNYTLPAGNPVVSGTDITVTWGNDTMTDLGTEIQDSLSRSGKGAMLGQFKGLAGTAAIPGWSWGAETNSGFFRKSAGVFQYSITTTPMFEMNTSGIKVNQLSAISGSLVTLANDFLVTGALTTNGNFIVFNAAEAGAPSANGGIKVERGTSADATIIWNETSDEWELDDGTTTGKIWFDGNLTLLLLPDTPATYASQAGKVLAVKGTEDGTEFITLPTGITVFTGLSDTPANYTGAAKKPVRVNAAGNALEFAFTPSSSIDNGDSPYAAFTGEIIAADVTGGAVNVTWNVTSAAVGDTLKVAAMKGVVATNALTVTLTGGNFTVGGVTDTVLAAGADNVETIMTVLSIGPVLVGVAL